MVLSRVHELVIKKSLLIENVRAEMCRTRRLTIEAVRYAEPGTRRESTTSTRSV